MASKLTRSNRAGWSFALPGFALISAFIILPFFFAFGLSLTNQRLISPNPTEFVGFENYRDLLGLAVITLEPERDGAGQVLRDEDGAIEYPRVRTITRSDDFPQYRGMREWFRWQSGEDARVVVASDVVFMKALTNTLLFVLIVAPAQGGLALCLALLINQRLRGINVFRTIYFMPVVVSIVVVSLLWRFIYDGNDGLLNNLLAGLTFGFFQPVDWLGNPDTALGSIIAMSVWQGVGFHMVIWLSGLQTISPTLYEAAESRGCQQVADLPLCHLAGPAQHRRPGADRHHHAGLRAVRPDRCDDQGGTARFHPDHRLPGGRARLWPPGHLRRIDHLGDPVPHRADDLLRPALADEGRGKMASITQDNHGLRLGVRYLVLTLIALIFIFPLVFMVVSSLKPDFQLLSDTSSLRAFLPVGDISLDNYTAAFDRAPVGLFVFNSVFVTGLTVILSLFICSLAAFSFVFLNWTGRDVVLAIIIATFIIPFETIAIPLLLIVSQLPWIGLEGFEIGWLNSYQVQIIPWIADGLTVFLFVQFFRDLPKDLIEASRVEGASWWQIYRTVVIPLSGPVIATRRDPEVPCHVQSVSLAAHRRAAGSLSTRHGRPWLLLPAQPRLG